VDVSSEVLEATRRRLTARFGAQRVEPWWERLPGVLAELAVRWDVVVGGAVGRGSTSLVVRCRRADGRPAMLGGVGRGLVAIDPRACVGDPAFDAVDWVLWATDDPRLWKQRSRELASALRADADGLWAWCAACAAILAASEVARGGPSRRVQALLAVAP
jgi:hypothetical protein